MRLGYFTMPLHPIGRSATETLQEDREAIILADRLGFYDAFVGEHLTELTENIPSSMLFLATLISDTKTIKLATGTSNLSQSHPVLIASHAALFDHLARGRFIFGIAAGGLQCDAEALGTLAEDRNRMFAEAIEVILAIWERESPYDIEFPGNRYKVSVAKTRNPELGRGFLYKPYQQPRPEIVGTVVLPYSKGVIAMGERDFHPLSANFLLAKWLPSHWANYSEGKRKAGLTPDPAEWRIARTIFVADDDRVARRYGIEDAASPYRYYWRMMGTKIINSRRQIAFKDDASQPDSILTEDYLVDRLVIQGTVNKVVDRILELREIAGDFGELVYAGMDWVDPGLARRSMELMATEVMPRVNQAIGARAKAPAAAGA
jgi:alkanesulfonate monooxygenase SsuD/methylene tetrahydromethanopterin reductase-like flavin-dependent oxidoreductase (luciferase family)